MLELVRRTCKEGDPAKLTQLASEIDFVLTRRTAHLEPAARAAALVIFAGHRQTLMPTQHGEGSTLAAQ
jgi:hypothetical protein